MRRACSAARCFNSASFSVRSTRLRMSQRPLHITSTTSVDFGGVDDAGRRPPSDRGERPAHCAARRDRRRRGRRACRVRASQSDGSKCSARAPIRVAIASASRAGSAVGSPLTPFASSAARRISSNMSRSLFEAGPSVPMPTSRPSSQHARDGRNARSRV